MGFQTEKKKKFDPLGKNDSHLFYKNRGLKLSKTVKRFEKTPRGY